MKNQEAIEFLKNMIDREAIGFVCPERESDVAIWQYHVEALQMAISALQAQDVPDVNVGGTISRQAAIDALMDEFKRVPTTAIRAKNRIDRLPSAQLEIIRCKDCTYGVQDEYGRWYCRSLGCQIGDEDGNGFCSDVERRTDEGSD